VKRFLSNYPVTTLPPRTRPFLPARALLCLGAASLFWFLNALNKNGYTLNVEYPVHFVYNDSLYVPTTPLPRTVTVNVSSDGWGLLRHAWLPFRVEPVDYAVKDPIRASVINTSSLAAAVAGQVKKLSVNYVVADTLELAFDRRTTKSVRLVVDSLHINLAPPLPGVEPDQPYAPHDRGYRTGPLNSWFAGYCSDKDCPQAHHR
jgi:hypothetical protein